MLNKRFKIKAVKTYKQPAYPTMDDSGSTIFTPNESSKLGEIAKEISKPVTGLAFATIISQGVDAAEIRQGKSYVTATKIDSVSKDLLSKAIQDTEKKPQKIKRFTEKQIAALLEELNIKIETNEFEHIEGKIDPSYFKRVNITEEQAKRILEKFFRRNGLSFDYNVPFKKQGVDFEADGYNKEKKIGWEFGYTCENELSQEEIAKLRKLADKNIEHLLLIDSNKFKGLPSGHDAVKKMQSTAEEFLSVLYKKGVLKPAWLDDEEIRKSIKDLSSKDEKIRKNAYQVLKNEGVSVLEKLKNEKETESIKKLISEIKNDFGMKLEEFYKSLDSEKPEIRDEATRMLINMDERALPYIKKLSEMAKQGKSEEVKSRLEMILKEVE